MTCSQDEPSSKKQKISDYHIEAVVGDEVRDPVPLVPVLTARIRNKKLTSKIVKNLNDHFPISQLSHLKRVNNRLVDKNNVLSVILWSCESDAGSSVEEFGSQLIHETNHGERCLHLTGGCQCRPVVKRYV